MDLKQVQTPLVSTGTEMHIDDWRGVVVAIRPRGGVMLKLDGGRPYPIDKQVVEDAVFGAVNNKR